MKNLSIKVRMILSLAIVAVLSLVTLIFALLGASISKQGYTGILTGEMSATQQLLTVRVHTNAAARYLRDMALNGYHVELENKIKDRIEQLEGSLHEFIAVYPHADGQEDIFRQKVLAWEQIVPQIIDKIEAGNQEEALRMLHEDCTPMLDKLSEQAVELSNALSNQVTIAMQTAQNASSQAFYISIGLTAFSFLITILLSVKLVRDIVIPLREAQTILLAMSRGELDHTTTYESKNEIGQMMGAVRTTQQVLQQAVADISKVISEMAAGHFNVKLSAQYPGDLAPIAVSIHALIAQISQIILNISTASTQVSEQAAQIADGAQALAQGASEQANGVEELFSTITAISNSTKENAIAAEHSKANSERAGNKLKDCEGYVAEMVSAMESMIESSSEISAIISTIETIAFQTNILALNASVEAARAGVAGKGFAVVADEVRNLAVKSNDAAKATKQLIEETVFAVRHGSEIMEHVTSTLKETGQLATVAVDSVIQISKAMEQESASIIQVTEGIQQISSVVQTNSATAQESAAASEELSSQAQLLKDIVQQFIM